MDNAKVDEVLRGIVTELQGRGLTPARLPPETKNPSSLAQVSHVLALAMAALEMAPERFEKKMRWMAWCQGVLWARNFQTIEEQKRANMPAEENHGP